MGWNATLKNSPLFIWTFFRLLEFEDFEKTAYYDYPPPPFFYPVNYVGYFFANIDFIDISRYAYWFSYLSQFQVHTTVAPCHRYLRYRLHYRLRYLLRCPRVHHEWWHHRTSLRNLTAGNLEHRYPDTKVITVYTIENTGTKRHLMTGVVSGKCSNIMWNRTTQRGSLSITTRLFPPLEGMYRLEICLL